MKKSELRKIIREEISELKSTPHQFGSDAERDYHRASAELSNAILDFDPENSSTLKRVEFAYKKLGSALDNYLSSKVG